MLMKKLLLTLFLVAATLSAKALTATVYVKAEKAPFLYAWLSNGTQLNGAWAGKQMTDSTQVTNKQGVTETFWCQTFEIEANSFNIIFNDGGPKGDGKGEVVQTDNISNISSDRYFTFDPTNPNRSTNFKDITDQYDVEIPDVEIQSVAIISDLNEWDASKQIFTEVEKNKKYTYNLDLTNETVPENYFVFKFMVNSSAYLDWNTEGMTRVDPNGWMEDEGQNKGNIGIDLDVAGVRAFLFTLEFAGGKDIYQGWTLTVGEGSANIDAIQVVDAAKAKPYNLSGQRVNANYRGLVIQNGKKVMK